MNPRPQLVDGGSWHSLHRWNPHVPGRSVSQSQHSTSAYCTMRTKHAEEGPDSIGRYRLWLVSLLCFPFFHSQKSKSVSAEHVRIGITPVRQITGALQLQPCVQGLRQGAGNSREEHQHPAKIVLDAVILRLRHSVGPVQLRLGQLASILEASKFCPTTSLVALAHSKHDRGRLIDPSA